MSAFQHTISVSHSFPAKKQSSSDFMATVTIHSDFGAQERKSVIISTFSFSICYSVMGADAMILECFNI